MEVLLVGTPSVSTMDSFVAAGHVVRRCHDPRHSGFACSALRGDGCPVEGDPIDVVVDVRPIPLDRPLLEEDGAICGVRRRIPLVVTGDTRSHPFGPWVAAVAEPGEVVVVAERIAASPLPEHSRLATAAAVAALSRAGLAANQTTVEVRRVRGKLQVRIDAGTPIPPPAAQAVTVAVAGEIRKYDPWAKGLDISVSP